MMGGKWLRYSSWTERNEFLHVKQQHVATMWRLRQSFDVDQAAWIRSRAPETNLHDKKSEDHHRLPIIDQKNSKDEEQTKAEHSDATPSSLVGDDKPEVQFPSPVKNEVRKGSTGVQKDTPDASEKPSTSRQVKATKKGSTSEIPRLKQAWSIVSRCKKRVQQGFHAGGDLGAGHQDHIETGDSWKWARQDSGPSPLLKQPLDALQEHAKQLFFRLVLVTDHPQTLLQLPGASLAQVLSDLDRLQGIQKYCDAVTAAIARAQAVQAVMFEQT